MALIGKIREKSWLLVLLIGLALLAFILSDYQSWFGGQEDQYGYGTVYGEMVDYNLYDKAVSNYQMMDQQQFQQQGREYTSRDQTASENKAWNAIVDSILLQREFDKLGISVSDNEFDAYLYGEQGFKVLPDIEQSFLDPQTGLFSLKLLQKRIEEMKGSTNADEQLAWEQTKRSLTMRRQQEKYFQLLGQGVYVTKLEAEENYVARNRTKSISFVFKRLTDIPDEDIKISDADLKKYYEEHKNDKKYENRSNSRELRYFAVDILPSKNDTLKFNEKMASLKQQFASKSGAVADSLFVIENSEWKYYIPKAGFRPAGSPKANQNFMYPAEMDTVFKAASVGTVVGPYFDNGSYRLAKVIGVDNQLYSVRHILLQVQRQDTVGVAKMKKTADSLMAVVNTDNFESLVTQYSADNGSKADGGKIENFVAGEMVPEFSDFAKNNPVGKIGYVQTDYGFHIIEVLEKKSGYVPNLAIVQQTLKPSSNTLDDIDTEVHDLLYDLEDKIAKKNDIKSKVEAFDTLVSRSGYFAQTMNLDEKNLQVYGMRTVYAEDKLIELAFDEKNEAGTLYSAPIKDESRYIIAMLTVKREKGVPSFEAAELTMRRDLMNEKKADKIKSTMTGKSVEELAKSMGMPEPQKADVSFSSPQIPGAGYEPEIIGTLFSAGLKDGQRTLPLTGKSAVYVIQINKTTKEPATKNFDEDVMTLENQVASNIQNDIMTALREKAEVVDNRRFLKVGIRR